MATLFRDDVYARLEQKVAGLSEVETALTMINHDEKLQRLLRQYAKKNGIITCYGDSYVGNGPWSFTYNRKRDDRSIPLWNNGSWDSECGVWNCELYIGPHQEREVAPIFLSHYNGDGHGPYATPEIVEKEDGFYVEDPQHGSNFSREFASRYHGQRITCVASLVGVSTKEILHGLEKALRKVIDGENPSQKERVRK